MQKCYCSRHYTMIEPYKCLPCPEHCNDCIYDNITNTTECRSCDGGYILNSKNVCIECPTGCSCCFLEHSNSGSGDGGNGGKVSCTPTGCNNGYYNDNGTCIKFECPANCQECLNNRYLDKDEFVCKCCKKNYILNKTSNECIHCPNNCSSCIINNNSQLVCDNCLHDFVLNKNGFCEECIYNEEIGGKGCLSCEYIGGQRRNKCFKCRDDYILIVDEYVCKFFSNIYLNNSCITAKRTENDTFECIQCHPSYVLVNIFNEKIECYPPEGKLVYCKEGYRDINGNLSCIKCINNYPFIWSEEYNQAICDNKCAFGFFLRYNWNECVECDNFEIGEIGCNAKDGCDYRPDDDHLYCNSCKKGYMKYDWQCLECNIKYDNCIECHFDKSKNKPKCDKCQDEYYFNEKTDKCELITYNEYPNVTPGCILPANNYSIYKDKNQCFDCKYGFFKTKDQSCIYCKARKNGGPKCDVCEYKNEFLTNEIKCKLCPKGNIFENGKCYNCIDEVGAGCLQCKFNKGTKIKCEKCEENYVLTSEGYCQIIYNYHVKIPHCLIYDYSNLKNLIRRLFVKEIPCLKCESGYYVNSNGKCEELSLKNCSLKSMLNYEKSIFDDCEKMCNNMNYAWVDYKFYSETIVNILKNKTNIDYQLNQEIQIIIDNGDLCLNNIENNQFRKCSKVEYNINTKTYKCSQCIKNYDFKDSNGKCIQIIEFEEEDTNICNNETILVNAEKGSFCSKPIGELEGCINAVADTSYFYTKYNCTKCSFNYLLYYSHFYKRNLCVGIKGKIEISKEIPSNSFDGIEGYKTTGGKCKEGAFTPDGIHCYKCNNKYVGMAGCQGSCTYSLQRNQIIECQGNCSTNYLETSKGLCETCEEINNGCKECYYDENYPDEYSGFKRIRRFVCKKCHENYYLGKDAKCHHCSEYGLTNCEICHNKNNEFECIKCKDNYFLSNIGYCIRCDEPKVQGINNNCIYCNDIENGGIEGCERCFSDNGNITCQQCNQGYFYFENNKTCVNILKIGSFEKFINCQKIAFNNNNFFCTKCLDNYVLLKENNIARCVNYDYIVTPKTNTLKYCKELINIGTEDKPKHSCSKCVENDIFTKEEKENGLTITKITFSENLTSYCDISDSNIMLNGCQEAIRIEESGIYNCINCSESHKYVFMADLGIKICKYFNYDKRCMVKNCLT